MSSRTYGGFDYRIDESIIQRKCPKEYAAFKRSFKAEEADNYSLEEFAAETRFEQDLAAVVPYLDIAYSYTTLVNAFHEKTGLDINLSYLSDEDDPEEEHQGAYWRVLNAVKMTPEAEKLKKYIHGVSHTYYA